MSGHVLIRTVCSEAIGFGHLRRCATLAGEIDVPVRFALVADDRGQAIARGLGIAFDVIEPGETVETIARVAPSALIVDDYAIQDFGELHARVPRLLVLDDLADRAIAADAILNAAPCADELPYTTAALRLFGPRYALLRREFRDLPRRQLGDVQRVLVTLGGSDPAGRSQSIAQRLAQRLPDATIEVVLGPLAAGFPDDGSVVVHRSPRDMVELMLRADLAVAAGGQTTYELAACGVPTVALCVADNQRPNLEALAKVPTLRIATDDNVIEQAADLAADRAARVAYANEGQRLFDGRGAERAWQALRARWFGAAS